jgi:hypothetical protein
VTSERPVIMAIGLASRDRRTRNRDRAFMVCRSRMVDDEGGRTTFSGCQGHAIGGRHCGATG